MSRHSYSLAIVSDIHYASPAEKARGPYYLDCIKNPARRLFVRLYRRFFWQHDPFAHNHLLDGFIDQARAADYVIANGDFSCDSGFVGLSDGASAESTRICLDALRATFGARFLAVPGDHEFGKKPLGAAPGGLRLASLNAARDLGFELFWRLPLGRYVLLGITSTLVALPVFEAEALPDELAHWHEARDRHLAAIRQAFTELKPHQRVLIFCHDPTALPFLWRESAVREKLNQVEQTIIGHLHTNIILWHSHRLAGMPVIHWLGHTPLRLSRALHEARYWRPFHVRLCPSLAGIELWNTGGFLRMELDGDAGHPARFRRVKVR